MYRQISGRIQEPPVRRRNRRTELSKPKQRFHGACLLVNDRRGSDAGSADVAVPAK
jgi:hypothetical protein